MVALKQLTDIIDTQVGPSSSMATVPQNIVNNVRNNMYVASEALRLMDKQKAPATRRRRGAQ